MSNKQTALRKLFLNCGFIPSINTTLALTPTPAWRPSADRFRGRGPIPSDTPRSRPLPPLARLLSCLCFSRPSPRQSLRPHPPPARPLAACSFALRSPLPKAQPPFAPCDSPPPPPLRPPSAHPPTFSQ